MWSSGTIQDFKDEATARAKKRGFVPAKVEDVLAYYITNKKFKIPFLAEHVPAGWELTKFDPLFIDLTGRDNSGPALSTAEFVSKVKEYVKAADHLALGFLEVGEFQGVVGVYKPDIRDFTHTGSMIESDLRKVVGGMDKESEITNEEREAVGMIQALLSVVGQSEPENISLETWRAMDEFERRRTRNAFKIFSQIGENREEK